jgi:hypothetical protein
MNNNINAKKFGFAVGITLSLFYLGCIIVMATAGHDGAVKFFNSILHGLDVSSIIRMDIPLRDATIGLIVTFILGWLFGAGIAVFYNATIYKK